MGNVYTGMQLMMKCIFADRKSRKPCEWL